MTSINERAEALHALHGKGAEVLVLANAWDVASARIVANAGAKAIATTSAGVAWSLGAADGDELDRDLAIGLIRRVVAAVGLPVTADIESGFGATPAEVAETVRLVLAAGAVGVNIEDSVQAGEQPLRPAAEMAERIAAARAAADDAGVPLYINARVDTYLRSVGEGDARLTETLERASAYLAAGASGIFVPGVVDPPIVRALVEGIAAPLNVLAGPGAPSVRELGDLGVARVSVGSSIASAAYALVQRAAEELFATGGYGPLAGGLGHAQLNKLFH